MKNQQLIARTALLALMFLAPIIMNAAETPKRALVVSTTAGFRHSSIPTAEKVLAELGRASGVFTVDYARLDTSTDEFKTPGGRVDNSKVAAALKLILTEKMSAEALQNYDLVIFANTTGNLPLPEPQALLDWIKEGHAFVGIHSATDTFANFPAYTEMIGGHFRTHGPQVEVNVINQDPACLACAHLGTNWTVFEEIYQFRNFGGTNVHRLLSLSELKLNASDVSNNKGTPGDYPVAWSREYGKGRVFYTSLGHREDLWDPAWADRDGKRMNSPETARQYQQHVLGGIRWALRLDESTTEKK